MSWSWRPWPRCCAGGAGARDAAQAPAPTPDADAGRPRTIPARKERLAWFQEAKYGLFIHWGLYAIPAGEWKGKRIPGIGEWIMNRAQDPGRRIRAAARSSGTP